MGQLSTEVREFDAIMLVLEHSRGAVRSPAREHATAAPYDAHRLNTLLLDNRAWLKTIYPGGEERLLIIFGDPDSHATCEAEILKAMSSETATARVILRGTARVTYDSEMRWYGNSISTRIEFFADGETVYTEATA